MSRQRIASLAVVVAAGFALAAPQLVRAAEPEASLVGLSVTHPSPDGKGSSAVFARNAGLELNFTVASDRDVIAIDAATCKLNAFVDSNGTDLNKSKGFGEVPWLNTLFGGSQSASAKKDEKRPPFAFAITSSVVPSKGTTVLQLDAVVGLVVGSDLKTDDVKDVALAVDTPVKLGNVDAKITALGKSYDGKLAVTFTSSQRLEAIQSLAFADASGAEIKSSTAGRQTMRMGDKADYSIIYVVPPGTEKATIKVTYYAASEVVPLKIQKTIGLGL